jgi:hypothetical protein
MKTFLRGDIAILFALCALVIGGCSRKSTNGDDTYGSVRFIHSAPSTDLIDFTYLLYDSDQYGDVATEVGCGEQNGYFVFLSGTRTFRVYLSGTSLSIASATTSVEENRKYTIIACDLDAAINPSLLAFADTTVAPSSGKAFLRFIHVSADAPDLDVQATGGALVVQDLGQYEASGYAQLDAGTYEFTVMSSSSQAQLLTLPLLTLTSGVSYSAILSGSIYGLPGAELNAKLYQETGVQ